MFSFRKRLQLERRLVLRPQSGGGPLPSRRISTAGDTTLGTMLEDVDILEWNDLNDFHVDKRIQLNISSDLQDMYDKGACSFSPTPNHLVAQSAYNKMMGEFYVRTIRGLNQWMQDYLQISKDDVQMYVHFMEKCHMFEGHRLVIFRKVLVTSVVGNGRPLIP
jgi:hypothetical protein